MEGGNFIFVYGTLLSEQVLKCLDFEPLSKRKAILPDFKRISIVGAVYPTAISKPGCYIEGMVYQVTAEDLQMLDIYEGVE